MDLQLGQRVWFSRTLRREAGGPGERWTKRWVAHGHGGREGVVVGWRTLSDGENRHGYDEPITFRPTEHFRAYLVAFDLRRKPVFVLPDDLTVLGGE